MAEDLYSKIVSNPIAKTLLLPYAYMYGGIGYIRLKAYGEGLMSRAKADVPVISIGNLSVGGTGKTPVTIDITRRLIQTGRQPAILSRGYKRRSTAPYTVVSDGKKIHSNCAEAGDEPYMMAQAVPEAIMISGKDRSATSRIACNEFHCDVIVLDDGFQHLKLRRDFDVVLLDYSETLDDALVPAGRLREPFGALGRATHIVISKVPHYPDPERMRRFQSLASKYAPLAQVSMCRYKPNSLRDGQHRSHAEILGKKVVALCGIARPNAFVDSIKQIGGEVVALFAHPDHHWFSKADLMDAHRKMEELKADYIVTTEKDIVRLQIPRALETEVLALVMDIEWLGDPPVFDWQESK